MSKHHREPFSEGFLSVYESTTLSPRPKVNLIIIMNVSRQSYSEVTVPLGLHLDLSVRCVTTKDEPILGGVVMLPALHKTANCP